MILAIFDLQVTPPTPSPPPPPPPTKFQFNWPLVQDQKQKIDFQNGHHGGHLEVMIGMISAIFDLQVILMLPKFPVNWPLGSGEEVKIRFSRQPPSWILAWNHFSFFLIYKSPRCFLPSFKLIVLLVQEKKRKIDFQDGRHGGHL